MNARTWVLGAAILVVIAVAVAGIVQWSAKKQSAVAAREVANGAPPMSATVDTPVAAATIAPVIAPAPVPVPVISPEERQQQAEALDASARAMREDTIEVQKRLRAEEAARREQAEAPTKDGARCINGQKMKRVQNGWVQAGQC